jgi:penicillin-binding protein 2
MSLLRENSILLYKEIDTSDDVYIDWRNGKLSPKEYLNYCISKQWIDIGLLNVDEKYADTSEVYQSLCDWIAEELTGYLDFQKILYKYMITNGDVKGRELCLILYDQDKLDYDEASVNGLSDGTISPSEFIMEKINSIEITPAQLALDPCTASTIITDVNTGQIKALVSYPGYDNNRLANGVDADYFNSLNADLSNPQYNYATQEKTAPGSTFKMVTATAGLAENVIDLTSEITCTGQFMEVSNTPKCWKYPGSHGSINVSEALRDSCNYFFYTVGYNLSLRSTGVYDDALGISYIQKYATLYGLDEKTGLEIEENTPEIANSYPVMAAIGQSNNNYTTASLSRYVTAVTSGKLYKYQLMESIVSPDGSVIASYEPESEDISDVLDRTQWDAIYSGMRMVVENQSCFDDFPIAVAGKTGTAQQVESRPNHALFVGFAPYENPEITIATRISYGYTSHNAAAVARNILSYYFEVETLDELLSANAAGTNASAENTSQD